MNEIVKQLISQIEQDQKLSFSTRNAYKGDLLDLLDYMFDTNTEISQIDHNWVKKYIKYLEETNLERNSFNRRASTFRLFLKFLYRNKMAPTNFSLIVNNKSAHYSSPEDLSDVSSIESIISETRLCLEERLILLFIGRIGLTATQIANLKTFQVDFENKLINVSDTEKIYLPNDTFNLLREYLVEKRQDSENLSLFIDEKGNPITELDIYRLVKSLNKNVLPENNFKLTTRNLKKLSREKIDFLSMQKDVLSVISPTETSVLQSTSQDNDIIL